jgi:hypothetical protein
MQAAISQPYAALRYNSAVRAPILLRSLLTAAAPLLLASCGSSSPTAPTGITPQTGLQVLRVTLNSPCPRTEPSVVLAGLLYSHVQVRQSGNEWIGTSTEGAGDVEVRLTSTGASPSGALHLTGTITGTARHLPELLPTVPAWESQMNFGSDRRTVLDAFSFAIPAIPGSTGVDCLGTGTVAVSTSAGTLCSGTQFSFSLSPKV